MSPGSRSAARRVAASFVALFCAVVAVSCSSSGESDASDGASSEATGVGANVLENTEWHLVSMTVDDEETTFEGSTAPALSFDDDTVMLDDGVNSANGPYTLDGEDFTAGPLAATRKAYPEPAEPVHALFGFVETATTAVVDGDTLTLTFPSGELTYESGEAEAEPIELADTSWRLVDVTKANESANATLAPVPAVVTFSTDTVDVYDGVNTASGTFVIDGSDLTVTLSEPSAIEYPAPQQPQYELIELLPTVESGEVLPDDTLRLTLADDVTLTFERAVGGVTSG